MPAPIELSVPAEDTKIASLLLQKKLLSEAQLKAALDYQRSVGGRIVDIILKLDLLRASQLEDIVDRIERGEPVARHVDLETVLDPAAVNLSELKVHRRLLEKLPPEIAEKYRVVLFFPCARVSTRKIIFGHGLPTPREVIDKARAILGVDICSLELEPEVVRGFLGEAKPDASRKSSPPEKAGPLAAPPSAPPPTEGPALTETSRALTDTSVLGALLSLLLRKGIITKEELQAELER